MIHLLITITASLLISYFSYRAKFLTKSGSIAQFILAVLILGLGGLKWTIPIVTFFLLSSLLSGIRKNKNPEVDLYFEKSGQRDYLQVIANGGLGGVLVIINAISSWELLYPVYVSSLAAVCADTWATEIGTLKKFKTYNILNFRPVEQGSSGGVSVTGIIGSALGAFIIPLSSVSFLGENSGYLVLLISISGLLAGFTDSVLGASVQAQFYCSMCSKITEHKMHCGKETFLKKGFGCINNDMVNLITSLAGGIFFVFLKICYK